jgi:hypothetical protein
MNNFTLKMIAMITMVIDHAGLVLFASEPWMRTVGRLSFPIFCFLIVEGVEHTRNKPRYLGMLILFALLSEVPFDLAFFHCVWYGEHQNVYWTLAFGVAMLYLCQLPIVRERLDMQFLIAITVAYLANWIHTDYGASGIVLIFGFYLAKKHAPVVNGHSMATTLEALWNAGFMVITNLGLRQMYAAWSGIFLLCYNGKRGPSMGKYGKYIFYFFYPVHLLILIWIR